MKLDKKKKIVIPDCEFMTDGQWEETKIILKELPINYIIYEEI